MSKYYLHDGQNQVGPFSAEELKQRNINLETYVWKEGMSDWVMVKELPELSEIFSNTPPPFKAQTTAPVSTTPITEKAANTKTYKTGNWIGRNPILSILIIVLFCVGIIMIFNSRESRNDFYTPFRDSISSAREKTPEELRMELQLKEKQNPQEYLKPEITMRSNFIDERVFEGTITNTASTATFKDVLLEISFLSKTESVISKERFMIYEVIPPQQSVSIKKIKTFAPKATEAFSITILNATPVD